MFDDVERGLSLPHLVYSNRAPETAAPRLNKGVLPSRKPDILLRSFLSFIGDLKKSITLC
jgi:hypothetical protein